jgi:putative addiction module component (TIGR02574 family)
MELPVAALLSDLVPAVGLEPGNEILNLRRHRDGIVLRGRRPRLAARGLGEALGLSAEERAAVAAALIDSLEGAADGSVAEAWRQALVRRRESLRLGFTLPTAWEEVRARLTAP